MVDRTLHGRDRAARSAEPFVLFWLETAPASSAEARERLAEFARRHDIHTDDTLDFLALVSEAVANAIRHSATTLPIEIRCRIERDLIVADVRDHGTGFDDPDAAHRFNLPHPGAEGGRGLPIMRSGSDVFSIESSAENGTRVVVGRRVRRTPGRGMSAFPTAAAV